MSSKQPHGEPLVSPQDSTDLEPVSIERLRASDSSPREAGLILIRTTDRNFCTGNHKPALVAINRSTKKAVFFIPRCKNWLCDYCADINRSQWVHIARFGSEQLLAAGSELRFATVTPHEKLSPGASLRVLPHAWSQLRKRLSRAFPGAAWLIIPEPHRSGKIHLHGVVAAALTKKWLKDNARECGFGYQCDVQKITDVGAVVGYTAGYIGKQMGSARFAPGFRRIRTSQNFPRPPELISPPGWVFEALPQKDALQAQIGDFRAMDYQCVLADGASAWRVIASFDSLEER